MAINVRLRVNTPPPNGRTHKAAVDVFRDGEDKALFGHKAKLESIEDRQRASRKIAERLLKYKLKVEPAALEDQLENELAAERGRSQEGAADPENPETHGPYYMVEAGRI